MPVFGSFGTGGARGFGALPPKVRWRKAAGDGPVNTVTVVPSSISGQAGAVVLLTAITEDAASDVLTNRSVAWQSSNSSVATVVANPLNPYVAEVTFEAAGTCNITALSEGKGGVCSATVTGAANVPPTALIQSPVQGFQATVGVAVTLDPTGTSDPEGGWVGTWTVYGADGSTVRFTHTGTLGSFASHVTQWTPSISENVTVEWVVTDEALASDVATITGNVTAAGPAPVASVLVTPNPFTVAVDGNVQLTATPRDAGGTALTGRVVTWGSNNNGIATVNGSGLVTGESAGSCTITATCETVPGTSACTVSAPVGGALTPNLPSDYVFLGRRQFNGTSDSGWTNSGQLTNASAYKDASTYTPVGATAPGNPPTSSPMIGECRYAAGQGGGGALLQTLLSGIAGTYRRLYIAATVQLSNNWEGHQSAVNKVLIATIHSNPCFVISATGQNANTLNWQFRLQDLGINTTGSNGQTGKSPTFNANLDSVAGRCIRGEWQRIEVILVANTPGTLNGEIHLWVTRPGQQPVKTHQFTQIGWCASGQDDKWASPRWEPIWGGTGDTVTNTMYQWCDDIIVYGKA